jgi:beta-glucanase (GH16 family)
MSHSLRLLRITRLSTVPAVFACACSATPGGTGSGNNSGSTATAGSGGASTTSGGLASGASGAVTSSGGQGGSGVQTSGASGAATSSGAVGSTGAGGSGGLAGSGSSIASDAGVTDADTVNGSGSGAQDSLDANRFANWVLSWSDEFNTPAGTKPDPTYWSYDLGGGGWGVGQLQMYTNNAANAETDGLGNLGITAIQDNQGNFTSARIKTQGKFQQAYGRFEIRAKVVTGNGMWPAFWMLGDDYISAGWPQCGEIDIMEVRGSRPLTTGGSLHGPGYSGMHPLSGSFSLPEGGPVLSDDFHVYAIEWEVGVVRFYVDDTLFETHTPADIPADAGGPSHWVYNHPFFILVNVGIGGTPPWGPPDGTTFPQTMLVDYVRAYTRPDGG